MKTKILKYFVLSICSYLILTNIANAQPIHSYTLNVSTDKTYSPLVDATVIAENISTPDIYEIIYQGSQEGKFQILDTAVAYPIGFDFMLEGIPMNRFAVSTQGYLFLGKDKVVSSGEDARFIQVRNGEGKRYMVGLNLEKRAYAHPETKISYKLEGTTPNRELVVEFLNLGYQNPYSDDSPPMDTVTFQIRLKESNYNILACFKNFKYSNASSNVDVWLCIKGGADKENLVFANHATDWTKAVAGYNTGKLKWSPAIAPPDNLFYEFIYPENCTTPIEQVSDLKLVPGSDYINLSYSKSSDVDRYLLIRSLESTLSAQPQDGINYTAGDKIGAGEVLQFSTDTSYLDKNLIPSTSYYYFVYAANYLCSEGPKYLISSPLNGVQKTFSDAPSITLKTADINSITVALTQNENQNQILLAITDLPLGFDDFPEEGGWFDVPSGPMQVGDIMPSGAKIIYKGSSKENLKIEKLNPGILYHFRVWSIEDGDTSYSTLVTDVDTCTTPIIPYKMDFQKELRFGTPYAWTIEGVAVKSTRIELISKTTDQILHMNKTTPTKGENTLMMPKILNLKNEKLRINFDLNYTFTEIRTEKPFLIWGEDSVLLQYSGDGENFTTFYVMDQKNRDTLKTISEYTFKRINLPEAAAALPEIYIRWKLINNAAVKFRFNNILIESIPLCEYPTKLVFVDGSIKAMQGTFTWTANGEERFWNLRYREENSDTWSQVEQASVNPFTMTDLKPNTFLQVQVQAVCTQENLSPWSDPTYFFQSGYQVPFIEQFNRSINILPLYWEVKAAVLSPDIKKDSLKASTDWKASSWKKEFKGNNAVLVEPGKIRDSSAWFLSPVLDLGNTNENYVLDFDLALVRASSSDGSMPTTVNKTLALTLLISTDGGETFKAENTLKTWDSTNNTYLNIAGFQHNSIDLSAYRGRVQLAWYIVNKDPLEPSVLYLDNIALRPSCSPAQELRAAGVGADSAYITWSSADANATWLLRYAKEGESEYTQQEVTAVEKQASLIIYDLFPQTDYMAYVSRICSIGDTAAWMPLEFTTVSLVPCAVPTALTASNIGKTTADLSWTATGLSYAIMFKNKTADQWIKTTSPITSIALKALSMGAEYEVKVQSVCSRASGDTSVYTDLFSFSTLEENCFAPVNIRSSEVSHTTATLKWSGESSAYLVSYKSETSAIYTNVNASDSTYKLNDLSPLTSYMVRIKSICSATDTSAWSVEYNFTTTDVPKCPPPTALKSDNISANEAELSWTKSDEHQNWVVRSRASSVTSWDTTSLINEASYKMASLLPNTAYVWTVKAVCADNLHSLWAGTQNFSTIPISMETIGIQDFKLYSENGQIHIINAEGYYIRSVDLIYPNGQIAKNYPIASDAHVSLPYDGKSAIIIVRINGKSDSKTYKIHCK